MYHSGGVSPGTGQGRQDDPDPEPDDRQCQRHVEGGLDGQGFWAQARTVITAIQEAYHVQWHLLLHASLAVVFVVAPEPGLPRIALVAAFRHPVEDRVVVHEELNPAPGGRVGLVDGAAGEREDAHRW